VNGKNWLTLPSAALLCGCAFGHVAPPANVIEVPVREPIDCPSPPAITPVAMRPVLDPLVFEQDGKQWAAIELRYFKNLHLNLEELKANYVERLEQLQFLRGCIARFNANVTPKEVTQ
jgi:hypothetical protein